MKLRLGRFDEYYPEKLMPSLSSEYVAQGHLQTRSRQTLPSRNTFGRLDGTLG